jgi:integrase
MIENNLLRLQFCNIENVKSILLETGQNRASQSDLQIKVANDLEAVFAWLKEYESVPLTHRSYQKEAQRLLLWCAIKVKKPLNDLMRNDFAEYIEFLANPEPRYIWCGPKSRNKEQWKPFVKGLSPSARQTAISIIHSLMEYLVQAGYLKNNPLLLIRKKVKFHSEQTRKMKSLERNLERDEIDAILQTIEALPENTSREQYDKHRTRFLIYLLTLTGLRINELTTHTWNSFRMINGYWWLFIKGKGDKPRSIPVSDELLQIIKEYRKFLNKLPYPLHDEVMPILCVNSGERAIGARCAHKIIKFIAEKTALRFSTQLDKAERIRKISPHSFRHIFATLQDMQNIPITQIRDNLGHTDSKTTDIYLHSADLERHALINKIKIQFNTLKPRG